ncbi:hypothetical protein M446_4964 [Methylobacterium sp. 4-46]|nr:hypothetical protein M446_4964 [Methylobacterium sp. 4-46]
MELLLIMGAVMMMGALSLFQGHRFVGQRGAEGARLERRGQAIAWDAPGER